MSIVAEHKLILPKAAKIVEALGQTLAPMYEVVLHDLIRPSTFAPFDILFVTRWDIRTNLAPALAKLSAGRYLSGTSNTSRFHLERR
jgi:hypothetical protein